MPEHLAIAVEGLSFSHRANGRRTLEGVSFTVTPGERLAIVGPNGAGKSTLLQMLNGLLMPDEGRVVIDGTPVERRTLREVRGRVGLVFQSPDDQLFCPTIEEDLRFGPQQFGWPRERIVGAVKRVAASLDLGDLLTKNPLELSMGERQRVAIATALILEPHILLLDEPTAALDPRRRRHLIELLAGLDETLVIATHDLDLAFDLCPRTLILNSGRIVADGPSTALLSNAELLERNELELPLRLQGVENRTGDQTSMP